MKNFVQFLADAKAQLGNVDMTDNAFAVRIGVQPKSITRLRQGTTGDPLAILLAELLGQDVGEFVCMARAEREPDPQLRSHLIGWNAEARRAVSLGRAITAATREVLEAA